MKNAITMCNDHWTKLRKAIDDRGLTHLVPNNGIDAAEMMKEGKPDPLMAANLDITIAGIKFTERLGIPLVGCPLCIVDKHTGGNFSSIRSINRACDIVLENNKGELN